MTIIGTDVEKLEPSDIAGGSAAALENSLAVSQKVKHVT